MGLASGPNAILNPSASELIGKPENVVTPTAVSAMTDAFRNGQITAADIVERTSARAQAKNKADIEMSRAQEKQAVEVQQNAALLGAVQKARAKQDLEASKLGPSGPMALAAYTAAGVPLPTVTGPDGDQVIDTAKTFQQLPQIQSYLNEKKRRDEINAAWEPKEQVRQDGSKVVGVWNRYKSGPEAFQSAVPPREDFTFEKFVSQMTPGTATTPAAVQATATQGLDVKPVAPPAPAPQAPLVQPLESPPKAEFLVTQAPSATDKDARFREAASRFAGNQVVKDAQIASTAYVATQDVLNKIKPDGSYTPDVKLPKQADYKLMVGYAKILDPNSVVREGEIYLLQGTSSAWANLMNTIKDGTFQEYSKKLLGQQMFTPQERQSFSNLLTASYQNRITAAAPLYDQQVKYLESLGATPGEIKSYLPWAPYQTGQSTTAGAVTPAPDGSAVARTVTLKSGKQVDLDAQGRIIRTREGGVSGGRSVPQNLVTPKG